MAVYPNTLKYFSLKFFFLLVRVEHWDVNNEDLHGDFYERHTGNPNITMQMFREINSVDPQVKLFLNDYAIMARDEYNQNATEAEKDDNKATVSLYLSVNELKLLKYAL